jgi:hypothetical protein
MAPVELQLYYRFVRKQGVLGSTARVQEIDSAQAIREARPIVNHGPLLFGTVAGCLLATASLSVLAASLELKATGEGLMVFVIVTGALSFRIDRKLRRVGRAEKANGVDKLLSGIVLAAVLYFIAVHTSPLILIPEAACAFLIVRGLLDVGGPSARKRDAETVAPIS